MLGIQSVFSQPAHWTTEKERYRDAEERIYFGRKKMSDGKEKKKNRKNE